MSSGTAIQATPEASSHSKPPVPKGRYTETAAFLAVLALAVLVRWILFIGYQGHDDRTYIAYGYLHALGGDIRGAGIADPWIARVGSWLPITWLIQILGASEKTVVVYSLLCSLGTVWLGFAFGRYLYGFAHGLLAAVCLAILPLDVFYATRAFADEAVGFWMVLACYLLVSGEGTGSRTRLFLGGVASGIAYLTKETSIFLYLPLFLYLRPKRKVFSRRMLPVVAGLVLVMMCEAGFWWSQTGDPLFRIHTTLGSRGDFVPAQKPFTGNLFDLIPGPKADEVFRSRNSVLDAVLMFTTNEEFGFLYYLVWPLVLYFAWKRDEATRLLRVWLAPLAILLLFFPFHFPWYTLNRDPRYYTCLSVPAVLLLVYWWRRQAAAWRWSLGGVFAASWVVCLAVGYVSSEMTLEREVAELRSAYPKEQIWSSNRLTADIFVLSGFDRRIPLGVHWLEEARGTGPGLSGPMRAMSPGIPVANTAAEIRQGLVVLDAGSAVSPQPCWQMIKRIDVVPGPLARLLQRGLGTLGVPERFVNKLQSRQVKVVYRVTGCGLEATVPAERHPNIPRI